MDSSRSFVRMFILFNHRPDMNLEAVPLDLGIMSFNLPQNTLPNLNISTTHFMVLMLKVPFLPSSPYFLPPISFLFCWLIRKNA